MSFFPNRWDDDEQHAGVKALTESFMWWTHSESRPPEHLVSISPTHHTCKHSAAPVSDLWTLTYWNHNPELGCKSSPGPGTVKKQILHSVQAHVLCRDAEHWRIRGWREGRRIRGMKTDLSENLRRNKQEKLSCCKAAQTEPLIPPDFKVLFMLHRHIRY